MHRALDVCNAIFPIGLTMTAVSERNCFNLAALEELIPNDLIGRWSHDIVMLSFDWLRSRDDLIWLAVVTRCFDLIGCGHVMLWFDWLRSCDAVIWLAVLTFHTAGSGGHCGDDGRGGDIVQELCRWREVGAGLRYRYRHCSTRCGHLQVQNTEYIQNIG